MFRSTICALLACLLSLPAGAQFTPLAPAQGPAQDGLTLRQRIDQAAIRAALREETSSPQPLGLAFGSATNIRFARAFSDARVPDCLHSEGLKRQPTFFFSGYLALPFIAVAKLRGKCN